jgi:hypothetical protein
MTLKGVSSLLGSLASSPFQPSGPAVSVNTIQYVVIKIDRHPYLYWGPLAVHPLAGFQRGLIPRKRK